MYVVVDQLGRYVCSVDKDGIYFSAFIENALAFGYVATAYAFASFVMCGIYSPELEVRYIPDHAFPFEYEPFESESFSLDRKSSGKKSVDNK